jgi:hypothetical protein
MLTGFPRIFDPSRPAPPKRRKKPKPKKLPKPVETRRRIGGAR